jgi:hypothetical protein
VGIKKKILEVEGILVIETERGLMIPRAQMYVAGGTIARFAGLIVRVSKTSLLAIARLFLRATVP